MKKLIAKTTIGQEYLYSRSTAHYVPSCSADRICSALNRSRFELHDGETWHVYDVEYGDDLYINQKFYIRNGRLFSAYI